MVKRQRASRVPRTRRASGKRRSGTSMRRGPSKRQRMTSMGYSFSRWSSEMSTITFEHTVLGYTYASFSKDFSLSELSGVADFSVLFDHYRIDKVEAQFSLQNNPNAVHELNNGAQVTSANFYPKLWYYNDEDDANSITLAQIREVQAVKCRVLEPNKVIKFSFKPKALLQVYGTGVSTGYANYNGWLDMDNTGIKHYGLKAVVDGQGVDPNDPFIIRVEYKYWVSFKNPK